MKEQEAIRLTNTQSAPTLKAGDIFMAEPGSGENKNISKPQETKAFVSPEQAKLAWQRYDEARTTKGKTISFEQRQAERIMAEGGIFPQSGGAESIQTSGLSEPRILREMNRLNVALDLASEDDLEDQVRGLERAYTEIRGLDGVDETQRADAAGRIRSRLNEVLRPYKKEQERVHERRETEGVFGQRLLTLEEKKLLLAVGNDEEVDKIFNRMFFRVDSSPKSHFNEAFGSAGNYEWEEFKRVINEGISDPEKANRLYDVVIGEKEKEDLDRRIKKYDQEMNIRQNLHTINYAVLANVGTEEVAKAANVFNAELADIALRKKGVTTAMHFFEQAMLKVMSENNGVLLPKEMGGYPEEITSGDTVEKKREKTYGRVEYLARKYFTKALDKDFVKGVKPGEAMDKWEIDRAFSLAKGMGIMLGRTIEIAASSKLPGGGGRIMSLYAQDIIKTIAPFRHVVGKFEMGLEKARIFAFLQEHKGPWSTEELEKFNDKELLAAVNGIATEEGMERYLSELNPLEIGGILTRTGWRYGDDPLFSVTGELLHDESLPEAERKTNQKIGTGLWIEKERDNLSSNEKFKNDKGEEIKETVFGEKVATKGEKARVIITNSLRTISRLQPLKLLHNLPELQKRVLAKLQAEKIYKADSESKDDQKNPIVTMKNQELKDDIDELIIAQEKALLDPNYPNTSLNFSFIDDKNRAIRLSKLSEIVNNEFTSGEKGKTLLDKLLGDFKNKGYKIPFILGADDIPYDEFNWAETGGTSIARRWRDIMGAKAASDGISGLISLMDKVEIHQPEDKERAMDEIVKQIRVIYDGISNYNEQTARRVSHRMAEGVAKFFMKDWKNRLPAGIGTINSIIGGKASYAQVAFGRTAMAWDELDLQQFAIKLQSKGMIPKEKDEHGVWAIDNFKKKISADKKHVAYGFARSVAPLLAFALLMYLLKKVASEK